MTQNNSNSGAYNPALGYPTVGVAPGAYGTVGGNQLQWTSGYTNSGYAEEEEHIIPKKLEFIKGVHRAIQYCVIEDNSYWVVVSDTLLLRAEGENYVTSEHTYNKKEIEPLFNAQGIKMISCSDFIEMVATRRICS